ncbi:MAG: hypothetical protein M4579_000823 [Chaenotheca gracillima]|nr:MAG: hypothetical protein M4579_000823 [Chaenotheca gracillima]
MLCDNLAQDKADAEYQAWIPKFAKSLVSLADLAKEYRGGKPIEICPVEKGSFNVCVRVRFEPDGKPDAMVRFPCPGRVKLPEEKVKNEVEVMQYLRDTVSTPIPRVLGYGVHELGPFIVMEFMDGERLSRLVMAETSGIQCATLDLNLSQGRLMTVYRNLADVLIELSALRFESIGSIARNPQGSWAVSRRPLTYNTIDLLESANVQPNLEPSRTFTSSSEYLELLAAQHIHHLINQRNDIIKDEADCRRKYTARHLFQKIVKNLPKDEDTGPFPLFCDDLRFSNMLVDKQLNITALIDFEFFYAAPVQFMHCPPWYLLLAPPEDYPQGLRAFASAFSDRVLLFLQALRERENMAIQNGKLDESQRLSHRMQKTMDDGTFWVMYAARKSFAFDDIYWEFLDERFFGERKSFEERTQLLSTEERLKLDEFVKMKMEQKEQRSLE